MFVPLIPFMEIESGGYKSTYRKKQKQNDKSNKYIYLLNDDKILKLLVYVNPVLVRKLFEKLIDNMDEKQFKIVDRKTMYKLNLLMPMPYVGKYKLENRVIKTENFKVPFGTDDNCSFLYLLNSIYDNISLTREDIIDLNHYKTKYIHKFCFTSLKNLQDKQTKICAEIIQELLANIEIYVLEEYDKNKLSQSLEYIDFITTMENLNIKETLIKLKEILTEAEANKTLFDSLMINVKLEDKNKKNKNNIMSLL